jgi:Zn-finger nucleic acid-binding protein
MRMNSMAHLPFAGEGSIGLCRKCRGIWLNCGELERLIARAIHGRDDRPRPALRHLNARAYAELFWDEA